MKRIFILASVLFSAMAVNAQSLGGRVGVNFSNMIRTGDDNFETEFKPGLQAGITLDIPLVDRLSFAPELMYSQKGYKTSGRTILGADNDYSVTTNFVEIPILLKIGASNGFNIHLGPQVSFLTSTTEKFESGDDEYKKTVRAENDDLRKNLIGGVIGAGLSVGSNLNLVARYSLDLQKNEGNGNSETPEYRNQVIHLGLGIRF